jgi:hypothetical protein
VVGEYRRARELAGGARPFSRGFRSPGQRVSFGSSARWWRLLRRSDAGRRPRSRSRSVRRSRLSHPRRRRLRCRRRAAGRHPVVSSSRSWWTCRSRQFELCFGTRASARQPNAKVQPHAAPTQLSPAPQPGAACRLQRHVRRRCCTASTYGSVCRSGQVAAARPAFDGGRSSPLTIGRAPATGGSGAAVELSPIRMSNAACRRCSAGGLLLL